MDLYDGLIKDIFKVLANYPMKKLDNKPSAWDINNKNVFLLDKEMAYELGGYPKDSVNIIIQSDNQFIDDGIYFICPNGFDINLLEKQRHLSFGKIVLLKTKNLDENNIYDFTQKTLIKDTKAYFNDVMTRASSKHYFINYKVSKKAIKEGFDIYKMASSIHSSYLEIDEVVNCAVIILLGDMNIYKELLPLAEKNKEISIALNHIFDGVNMDCKSCDMTDICDEIKELRAIHKKQQKG